MKILADFYLYNIKKENVSYNLDIKLSTIIKDINEFLKVSDKNINFEAIVTKCSELYDILNQKGDLPLYELLKINKKFKICYGGYIKFKVIYNSKEQFTIFEKNQKEINNGNINKLFLVYDFIMKYLTIEERLNLSLINKNSYKTFLEKKLFQTDITFKNICLDEEEAHKKLINFRKLFGGHSMGLYEVKKLGMYVGEKFIYLLIQSVETYNVEILKLNKTNIEEHEIIFRDNWTNYYLFDNTVYQIKNTKEKTKLNKIDKNEEINFISINVTNLGDEFDSEYFYYYKETKEIYIVTSELKIYKFNKGKKKLKLFFDESKKLKKFKDFTNLCKIRNYWKYYKFIGNKFFLSLLKFHIFDITNKKLILSFPEIRGVESVQKIVKYYYVVDYRFGYLLKEKNLEMMYKLKKYNNELCCNSLLRIDPFLNYIQTTMNDYTIDCKIDKDNKNWYKKLKLKNLFFKFSNRYLCSDYFNDKDALYIKLFEINDNKNDSLESIKRIRIKSDKFIKKLKFEDNIKGKIKNEIINNIKYHLYFNGFGDFVINMNEYFWIYHYIDEINIENSINNINDDKKNILYTYNKIIIKTNDIMRYENIIFYDKIFIVWKQKSLKILYYELDNSDMNIKKESKKEKNKFNKNVKILQIDDNDWDNIEIETPIFLFQSSKKLFLFTNFSEENYAYGLYEIKIAKEKILLLNSYIIKMNSKESIQNNESFIFAKFIFDQKFLVVFSTYNLYFYKKDESNNNVYNEIKRKEHNIIGHFRVKELYEEETCFIAQDDRTKDCLFFDVMPWIQE